MKLAVFLTIITVLLSCKPTQYLENNKVNPIIYILPLEVENVLKAHFLDINKDSICLELRKEGDDFSIFVNRSNIFWKSVTNRQVIVGTEYYPLIFDFDSYFGTAENIDVVLKRLKYESKENPFTRKQVTPIYDNVFMIKFKKNGEILHKGSSW